MAQEKQTQLDWKKARCRTTDCAKTWLWISRCGRYAVQLNKSLFSEVPDRYYAMRLGKTGHWSILISQHRKRSTAETACERHIIKQVR